MDRVAFAYVKLGVTLGFFYLYALVRLPWKLFRQHPTGRRRTCKEMCLLILQMQVFPILCIVFLVSLIYLVRHEWP